VKDNRFPAQFYPGIITKDACLYLVLEVPVLDLELGLELIRDNCTIVHFVRLLKYLENVESFGRDYGFLAHEDF
jgi:hypothetical protein